MVKETVVVPSKQLLSPKQKLREVNLLLRGCSKRADLEKTRKSTLNKAAEFKRTILQERGDTTEREEF